MARLDFGQHGQIRDLVSELTIQRATAAVREVAKWEPSKEKLLILGALEGIFGMRAQHFGSGDPDFHAFMVQAGRAGEGTQKTRLALLIGPRPQDAAAGGHDCFVALLGNPAVMGMLEFPRQAPDRSDALSA